MPDWSSIARLLVENLALHRRPMGLHYQSERPEGAIGFKSAGSGCLVALLKNVEKGKIAALSREQSGCFGGRLYCGFADGPSEGQAEYVSTGIPGRMEGEHYLKSPELVRGAWRDYPPPAASDQWLVFQLLDMYGDDSRPEVVFFFARPDSIAGLHFLACYDRGVEGVIAPFTSGCGGIVGFPRLEAARGTHRAVLGLFDPSARITEEADVLSFAVDVERFLEMVGNIGESFLQHPVWAKLKKRMISKT